MYTVCLVEDEQALSNVVKAYLERAGYETICFEKGSDAVAYIGNKVDLWILDIMLKDDVNGYDIIKETAGIWYSQPFSVFILLMILIIDA